MNKQKAINILIIDDNYKMINSFANALNVQGSMSFNIFPEADNIKTFAEKIQDLVSHDSIDPLYAYIEEYTESNNIDVIALDFYLNPSEETNFPIKKTDGYLLLNEIRSKKEKFSKIPIYSFTFKQEELSEAEGLITSGTLQGAFPKSDEGADDIESQLMYNISYTVSKYREIEEADIVVVCALKKEIEPIINLLKIEEQNNVETFAIGYMEKDHGEKLKVVAVTKEQMGMAEAATLTTQMIEKYNPKFVVMTGIAAGIKYGDEKFLDILIPSSIFNWQSGKFKIIKENNKIIHLFEQKKVDPPRTYVFDHTDLGIKSEILKGIPKDFLISNEFKGEFTAENIKKYVQGIIEPPDDKKPNDFHKDLLKLYEDKESELKQEIKFFAKNNQKVEELEEELEKLTQYDIMFDFVNNIAKTIECNIQKKGMVSGSAVVADEEIKESEIKSRDIHGIDMEAYGVAYACNQHPSKPEVLIIKAICDFADSSKNDAYQRPAAYVSAQVFHKLFTEEYIDMG